MERSKISRAGKQPEKMLVDPGFAISQATLDSKRDDMWGYHVWKEEEQITAAFPPSTA